MDMEGEHRPQWDAVLRMLGGGGGGGTLGERRVPWSLSGRIC